MKTGYLILELFEGGGIEGPGTVCGDAGAHVCQQVPQARGLYTHTSSRSKSAQRRRIEHHADDKIHALDEISCTG